jgi:CheY-like chemotaxis protein
MKVKPREGGGSVFTFTAQFETIATSSTNGLAEPLIEIENGLEFRRLPHSVDVVLVESNPFSREILRNLLAAQQIHPQEIVIPADLQACLEVWLQQGLRRQTLWVIDHTMLAYIEPAYLLAQDASKWRNLKWIVLSDFGLNHDVQNLCALARTLGIRVSNLYKPVTALELQNNLIEVSRRDEIDEAAADPAPSKKHAGKVLVVEDTPMNQQLAQWTLQKLGCTVDIAANGEMALQKIRAETYDLILMDLQMPGMDGITATYEIRRIEITEALKMTPIVAMTAHVLDADRAMAKAAGMQDFLIKPVSADEFQRVLNSFL